MRNRRLYPIKEETFNRLVLPIILDSYVWKGRPPKISHYNVFCAILYVLRTGVPWRDFPALYARRGTRALVENPFRLARE